MKIKNLLRYETETGKSFFDLAKKFEEGSFSMHDIRDMVYVVRLSENKDLKIEDAISDDDDLDDLLTLVQSGLGISKEEEK